MVEGFFDPKWLAGKYSVREAIPAGSRLLVQECMNVRESCKLGQSQSQRYVAIVMVKVLIRRICRLFLQCALIHICSDSSSADRFYAV